jgi:dihydrofolate reductase
VSRTQYYCAATLDGYIADEGDGIDWLTGYEGRFEHDGVDPGPMAEGGAYERFYEGIGALVSGSTTYEFVVDHLGDGGEWPYRGKPYWVLSSRDLPVPAGDAVDVRVVEGAVEDLHDRIAATADERNVWVVGGGNVASQFADAGRLDDVLVTVVPVVLSAGKPLFERSLAGPMQLAGSRAFGNGMVELRYSIAR